MSGAASHNYPASDFIPVRTRSGKKIHMAYKNGSTTRCGVWLKADAGRMRVSAEPTCETCLSLLAATEAGTITPKGAPTVEATPAPEPAPALIASLMEQNEAEQDAIYAEHERLHEQGQCPPDCWLCQDEAMMREDSKPAPEPVTRESAPVAEDKPAGRVNWSSKLGRGGYGWLNGTWEPVPVEAEAPADEPLYIVKWHDKRNPETYGYEGDPQPLKGAYRLARQLQYANTQNHYSTQPYSPYEATNHAVWLARDGFVVTPPSEEDAWQSCTCDSIAAYLGGPGPHHAPDCPEYAQPDQEEREQIAQAEALRQQWHERYKQADEQTSCTCGAIREGYKGRGPHHYKNCRMYSQEGADQETRMLTRESSTLPQLYQQVARPRMGRQYWEQFDRDCEDFAHNEYRG